MNKIKEYTEKVFEDIKHLDKNEEEYWNARKLQCVLEYCSDERIVVKKYELVLKTKNYDIMKI